VVVLKMVPIMLTSAAFAFLYRTVPARSVDVNDAVAGGLVAGLLFEGMKTAFGAYLRQVPTYKLVYGAFASFPIFLIWIYISWLIILAGAVFAAALPYLRRGGVRVRRTLGSEFVDALRLMRLLQQAHVKGQVMTADELRAGVRLPLEQCEDLLERLARPGWVARASGDGWVLARDAAEIRLAEVYRNFVFDPDAVHREHGERGFEGTVASLTAGMHDKLTITLKTLFARHE
jgi:membrane protein